MRRAARWTALAGAMLAMLWAARARAQADERVPERPRLRLDESPDLVLLAPFRHASDPSRTLIGRWQRSTFGSWARRSWHTLDWEAGFEERSRGAEAPINPNVALGRGDTGAKLWEPERRWPYVVPRESWFEDAANTTWTTAGVRASRAVMPPWLARVDVAWAHALVLSAGCGRGGECSPGDAFPAGAFLQVWDALSPEIPPTPWWECRERPFELHRYGQEKERFVVLNCDGSIPEGALERLSVLARPPDVEKPDELPLEPTGERGEWLAGIRIMHPRLLWVLHRIALAFPWRAVHLYSGYRPAEGPDKPGSHTSQHAFGRALDLSVQGVSNEELFALCHKLADVGCGYYPNGKFVHLDIRFHGSGLWVDASAPGEPSRYVDGWPNVVDNGRFIWKKP